MGDMDLEEVEAILHKDKQHHSKDKRQDDSQYISNVVRAERITVEGLDQGRNDLKKGTITIIVTIITTDQDVAPVSAMILIEARRSTEEQAKTGLLLMIS